MLSYLVITWIGRALVALDSEAAVVRAAAANADLWDEVAILRDKPAISLCERDQAEARGLALTNHVVSATEAKQRGEIRPQLAVRASLEAMAKKPQQVSADRDRALGVTTELAQSETVSQHPVAPISDAPPEPERSSRDVAEFGRRAISEFARMLASTGLNIERLFPQFGLRRVEGGPFVPPPQVDQPGGSSADKLEALRSFIRSLPLSTPLDHYQLESRFGRRHDPFNHRTSFHTGLDLSAPYMAPVYATAAGIVTYAGYQSDYGKVVEISHGNGIATIYGHLHRYTVSVGEAVAEHTQIGFLGSSGRSSGPHVHYEIRVNDEPQDPEKFLGLARLISAADK